MVLEVTNASIKQIPYRQLLKPLHGISLPTRCLSVSEYSDDSSVEYQVKHGIERALIQTVGVLIVGKCVVKPKLRIVNVLSDAIHFVLTLMHYDRRVRS